MQSYKIKRLEYFCPFPVDVELVFGVFSRTGNAKEKKKKVREMRITESV